MAAVLKLFLDKECTKEIITKDGVYDLLLAPSGGINGHVGQVYTHTTYLKNVGDRAALHVTVSCTNQDNRAILRVVDTFIDGIPEQAVVPIRFTSVIKRWTKAEVQRPTITIDWYTLPDIDETFHNPYVDKREVVG